MPKARAKKVIKGVTIYSSSFFQYSGDNGVSIARTAPEFFKGPVCRELNPGPWFKSITIKEYIRRYFEILSGLYADDVYIKLQKLVSGVPVLLCWERAPLDEPGAGPNFCHRTLVGYWLREEIGVNVIEIGEMKLNDQKCQE